MVTEHVEANSEGQMELSDDDEEALCKVWDMAMDKVEFLILVPETLCFVFPLELVYLITL